MLWEGQDLIFKAYVDVCYTKKFTMNANMQCLKNIYFSFYTSGIYFFYTYMCSLFCIISPPPLKKKKIIVDIVCKKMF